MPRRKLRRSYNSGSRKEYEEIDLREFAKAGLMKCGNWLSMQGEKTIKMSLGVVLEC